MSKNDTLKIYYLTKNSKVFSESLSRKAPIEGDLQKQFVEICLPEEPIDLRIRFGDNSKRKEFKILSFLLENHDNQIFIQKENMVHNYFVGNKSVKYNKQTNTYFFTDATSDNITPFLSARKVLKERLKKRLNP